MKIPFALDEKGRVVDIHDVPPHVEGAFRCVECRRPVTRKQGDVRVWHFAHKDEAACTKAFETALHLLAKQVLVESDMLRVPALVCQLYERPGHEDITLCVERTFHWDAAGEAEVWVDGIRPDFRSVCQGKAIFVEVTVTHEPDAPKLEALKRLQTPTLEIDLSAVPRDVTAHEVRRLVLDATEGKRWVFYPGEAEARAYLKALRTQRDAAFSVALERERQEERRFEAARVDARVERLRTIERANACFRDSTAAQKLTFLEAKLCKPVNAWPASLGHDVRGGSVFRVSTRIWQADVFRKYIHGQRTRHPNLRVTVEVVAEWLVQRYAIASTDSTFVRVAVWDFLSALERVGYLRRRVRQEFEILRDVLGDESKVPSPKAKAVTLEAATRGLIWSRDLADESQFWSAVRKTGVHVAPGDARMFLSAWQDAKFRRANAAAYVRSVAATLRIPIEKAVEFLTAAGVFLRVVA